MNVLHVALLIPFSWSPGAYDASSISCGVCWSSGGGDNVVDEIDGCWCGDSVRKKHCVRTPGHRQSGVSCNPTESATITFIQ